MQGYPCTLQTGEGQEEVWEPGWPTQDMSDPVAPDTLALGWAGQVLLRNRLKIYGEWVGTPMFGSLTWVSGSVLSPV